MFRFLSDDIIEYRAGSGTVNWGRPRPYLKWTLTICISCLISSPSTSTGSQILSDLLASILASILATNFFLFSGAVPWGQAGGPGRDPRPLPRPEPHEDEELMVCRLILITDGVLVPISSFSFKTRTRQAVAVAVGRGLAVGRLDGVESRRSSFCRCVVTWVGNLGFKFCFVIRVKSMENFWSWPIHAIHLNKPWVPPTT